MDKGGEILLIFTLLASKQDLPPYAQAWEEHLDVTWDLNKWHCHFQKSSKSIINTNLTEALKS